ILRRVVLTDALDIARRSSSFLTRQRPPPGHGPGSAPSALAGLPHPRDARRSPRPPARNPSGRTASYLALALPRGLRHWHRPRHRGQPNRTHAPRPSHGATPPRGSDPEPRGASQDLVVARALVVLTR